MSPLYIEAISLYGPGLPGWKESLAVLRAPDGYSEEATAPLQSGFLTPHVKRRTTQHMQLAIYAADKALEGTDTDLGTIETVFASSEGDLNVAHHILYSLTLEGKPVSPTKFQNVILNAAAGHLGILLKNTASATSVTGSDNSLAVGLLQSYTTALIESVPILFVSYDAPAIIRVRQNATPIDPFAVGFLFRPHPTSRSIASLKLELRDGTAYTTPDHPLLAQVSERSSTAGSLPLLIALAKEQQASVALPYSAGQVLNVEVSPCRH